MVNRYNKKYLRLIGLHKTLVLEEKNREMHKGEMSEIHNIWYLLLAEKICRVIIFNIRYTASSINVNHFKSCHFKSNLTLTKTFVFWVKMYFIGKNYKCTIPKINHIQLPCRHIFVFLCA